MVWCYPILSISFIKIYYIDTFFSVLQNMPNTSAKNLYVKTIFIQWMFFCLDWQYVHIVFVSLALLSYLCYYSVNISWNVCLTYQLLELLVSLWLKWASICGLRMWLLYLQFFNLSRNPHYKDVYRRTIEMPQRAHAFKVNCCLKVHNEHLKLLLPISG